MERGAELKQGYCKLFRKYKPLQDSHYYPRALYKVLRDIGEKNPNPVLLTNTTLVRKSQHIKDYVLCHDCEQLFSRKGEQWVARNTFTGTQFHLQQRLLRAEPVSPTDDERMIAYAGAEIEGVDMEKLVYFGISLFWRASVHKWRLLDGFIHSPLGPYEEVLRRHLLGTPLPREVTIHVYLSPRKQPWRSFVTMPPVTEEGLITGRIFLAGITYELRVGNVLPVDLAWCSYHSPRKYIFTSTTMDDANTYGTVHTYLEQSGHDKEWSVHLVV